MKRKNNILISFILISFLSACGMGDLMTSQTEEPQEILEFNIDPNNPISKENDGIFDLFDNKNDSESILKVNRYIWKASLEVLSFLPLEAADPFSGIIKTGWGSAPGSNTQYKVTVYIQDPSLDARSLRVSVLKKAGPANITTVRIVENAILSRARQLRLNDDKL